MINSYLDEMIEKVSRPDKEVRAITRAEIARLNELEVQTLASVKMYEKELAEMELKMVGLAERERIARERGDASTADSAGRALMQLASQRDLLKQQISEAKSSAARSRALREERRVMGEELANETHLTSMRENLAGIQTPFDATDPSATIEEMRMKLNRPASAATDARIAELEHEQAEATRRAQVDDVLSRYKQSLTGSEASVTSPPSSVAPQSPAASTTKAIDEEGKEEPKTLGRNSGPVRPID
jgi:hypothetical protein